MKENISNLFMSLLDFKFKLHADHQKVTDHQCFPKTKNVGGSDDLYNVLVELIKINPLRRGGSRTFCAFCTCACSQVF